MPPKKRPKIVIDSAAKAGPGHVFPTTPHPKAAGCVVNEYSGWQVPAPPAGSAVNESCIPRVSVTDQTPEEFFERYVVTRKPVILTNHLADSDWHGSDRWTDVAYLREHAGDQLVEVEKRGGVTQTFGRGTSVKMPFGEFLDKMVARDELHYMTTQKLALDSNGCPALDSAPVTQLRHDFPLRPALLGNLIPMNMNLWMGGGGSSATGSSSSGLHHDYHDNLYILIQGRKTFRLFSPADADVMPTVGKMARVHPNGRVNYDGLTTHADGRDEAADQAVAAEDEQAAASQELEAAEDAVDAGEAGAEQRLEQAERRMEVLQLHEF
jgi:hypothetical protein